MNKINDIEIKEYLQEQYEFLKTIYNENRILGLFTYGKVNQGFAKNVNDIKTVMCYLPSFEEVCLGITLKYEEIDYGGNKIRITDVRNLYEKAKHQELVIMEATFSEYRILNQKYLSLFTQYIYMNKESIFHANKRERLLNAINRGKESLEIYKNRYDVESLFEACRIRIATSLFLDGASIENCINLKKDYHTIYLWQILNNELEVDIKELEEDLIEIEKRADQLEDSLENELARTAVLKIMSIAMKSDDNNISFLDSLTSMEAAAFKSIVNKLDDEYKGNISIVQLIEETKISRPVYKNILNKMKNSGVAEVNNQGVKGTFIEILDRGIISSL